jgi:hypothetical protein
MKEEADSTTLEPARIESAARQLAERFPREQVATYFNVLLLQDPERWSTLEKAQDWL